MVAGIGPAARVREEPAREPARRALFGGVDEISSATAIDSPVWRFVDLSVVTARLGRRD
jgi:hypothetical protein